MFSVMLMGKTVLEDFDVTKAGGGPRRAIVKEYRGVEIENELEIRLLPSQNAGSNKPILCGFQAFRE